jgi:hypothetical protein
MSRKKGTDVKVNNNDSLEGLMQETYNDACLQINEAQRTINELVVSLVPTDIDDATKIAKEKAGLLKVKDSAIRIKLELAKLQADIIKHRSDETENNSEKTSASASLKDFKKIRDMLKNDKKEEEIDNED